MKQNATVLKVENGRALVRIWRDSACGDNCKCCGLCDRNAERWVLNPIGACIGDRVTVFIGSKHFLTMCIAAYILPVAVMIFGFVFIDAFVKMKVVSDMLSLLLVLLTVSAFALVKFNSEKFKSRIIKIR